MDDKTLRESLLSVYEKYWTGYIENIRKTTFSAFPFLLWPKPGYAKAPVRIMVCGQETQGWGNELDGEDPSSITPRKIAGIYNGFVNKGGYNSPYWNFSNKIAKALPNVGFIHDNIVKIGHREAAWDALDSLSNATQMKVVILPDGTVARYVREDDDTYTVDIQDSFTVKKEGTSVEIWSAAEGKGVVYMKTPGMAQVLYEPDSMAGVKCDLTFEEGECPSTYRCLGLEDGWYEISLGEGGTGFIQARQMNWDAIDTF